MSKQKTYVTKQGDMWDLIAYNELGSTKHTHRLMLANQDFLAYHIFPEGIPLVLPEVPEVVNYDALPPWRRDLLWR